MLLNYASLRQAGFYSVELKIKTEHQEALNATNSQTPNTWNSSRLTIITVYKNYA